MIPSHRTYLYCVLYTFTLQLFPQAIMAFNKNSHVCNFHRGTAEAISDGSPVTLKSSQIDGYGWLPVVVQWGHVSWSNLR